MKDRFLAPLRLSLAALPLMASAACSKAGPGASPTSSAAPLSTPTTARPADTLATSQGELRIVPLHHGTVGFEWQGRSIVVDPHLEATFKRLPKADVVFLTDLHPDHLDAVALDAVREPSTIVVAPPAVAALLPRDLPHVVVMKNGEAQTVAGIGVEAIPMYNLTRGPSAGALFHDKGRGNGYVLTFGDKRVYLSGDTECTDEMRALKAIDVAFVCMNLPYTMPPSEAAACVEAFRPKVVYPYHYRGSNLEEFTAPLAADKDIEVRVRSWY